MADFDNNTDTTTSSSGSTTSGSTGSSDSTSSKPEDTASEAQLRPQDTPAASNMESNAENAEEASQAEARSRSLGEKSNEVSIEKTPDQIRQEEIQRKIGEAVVRYNLNSVEAQNLSVSASQPGIEVTQDFMKKQVQAIAPDKLVIAEFREKMGQMDMTNVDNNRRGELPLQAVGQQVALGATISLNRN